jgi:hypothetical protein
LCRNGLGFKRYRIRQEAAEIFHSMIRIQAQGKVPEEGSRNQR